MMIKTYKKGMGAKRLAGKSYWGRNHLAVGAKRPRSKVEAHVCRGGVGGGDLGAGWFGGRNVLLPN